MDIEVEEGWLKSALFFSLVKNGKNYQKFPYFIIL